jgi:hypothetical protein
MGSTSARFVDEHEPSDVNVLHLLDELLPTRFDIWAELL